MTLLLETSPLAFALTCHALGLLIGSFLNVVIHRLPIMLEREWQAESARFGGTAPPAERYDLVLPPPVAPTAAMPSPPWTNLPILSYIALRGRCSACRARISPRYVLVETACGLLSAWAGWHFGFGWQAWAPCC